MIGVTMNYSEDRIEVEIFRLTTRRKRKKMRKIWMKEKGGDKEVLRTKSTNIYYQRVYLFFPYLYSYKKKKKKKWGFKFRQRWHVGWNWPSKACERGKGSGSSWRSIGLLQFHPQSFGNLKPKTTEGLDFFFSCFFVSLLLYSLDFLTTMILIHILRIKTTVQVLSFDVWYKTRE